MSAALGGAIEMRSSPTSPAIWAQCLVAGRVQYLVRWIAGCGVGMAIRVAHSLRSSSKKPSAPVRGEGLILRGTTLVGQTLPSRRWWSRGDSNPLPPHCQCGVLPSELRPQRLPTLGYNGPTRQRLGVRIPDPGVVVRCQWRGQQSTAGESPPRTATPSPLLLTGEFGHSPDSTLCRLSVCAAYYSRSAQVDIL